MSLILAIWILALHALRWLVIFGFVLLAAMTRADWAKDAIRDFRPRDRRRSWPLPPEIIYPPRRELEAPREIARRRNR